MALEQRLARGGTGTRQVVSVAARRGSIGISEWQRSRMLSSAVEVVSEFGYDRMTVARVTGRAGVSRRTFYDLFADREDCFLAAFEEIVEELAALLTATCESDGVWREQVRAGVTCLLRFLDEQPGVGSLLVVEALGAGPRILRRRGEILARLAVLVHQSGCEASPARKVPPLVGEGVVGAVLGVLHTRLLQERPGSLLDLLNPLMAIIVLPYEGPSAAQKELDRTVQGIRPVRLAATAPRDPLSGLQMRITYRTLLVLNVIGYQPGISNRGVANGAEVSDQGQISKLLARLEGLGLIVNTSPGQPSGEPNAWYLTPRGQGLQAAIQARADGSDRRVVGMGESH